MQRAWVRLLGLVGSGALLVALTARAGGDDRARAEGLLAAARANPSAERLAGEPLGKAKDALRRAEDARRSGDSHHAALLDALGREWAETAETVLRAQAAERRAAELERQTADLETKTTRARTLLEETVARRGRARADIDALEASDGGRP